jgi:hypothetical protein
MAVVAVKTVETEEALETVAVIIMTAVLTIKVVATLVMTAAAAAAVMALIEAAVTERVVAVYRRGRWFVSNVSDIRIMWNIISPGYLNNDHPWSSV